MHPRNWRVQVAGAALLGALWACGDGTDTSEENVNTLAARSGITGLTPGPEARIRALEHQMSAMRALIHLVQAGQLQVVSDDGGTTVRFLGVNVQIVNGLGATETANAKGNLIIGYNEPAYTPPIHERSGSHYLVIGSGNDYEKWGGMVVGDTNFAQGAYASIVGSQASVATGVFSTVIGSWASAATGSYSTVSGGRANQATNSHSSVFGGAGNNIASGNAATICGGGENTASAIGATVSGGFGNTASGLWSSVSGGRYNTATGDYSSVSGGEDGIASGEFDWTAGDNLSSDQ